MAMLGDLLAAARRASGDFEVWLGRHDPVLLTRVRGAAEAEETSPGALVRAAVADFSNDASGEDWASVTSMMRDSDDPGVDFLAAVLRWRLDPGSGSPARYDIPEGGNDERSA